MFLKWRMHGWRGRSRHPGAEVRGTAGRPAVQPMAQSGGTRVSAVLRPRTPVLEGCRAGALWSWPEVPKGWHLAPLAASRLACSHTHRKVRGKHPCRPLMLTECLLCARPCGRGPASSSHRLSGPGGVITVLIAQTGKLRHGDLKQLASSHTASKWQSQDPSPGRLGLVAVAGPCASQCFLWGGLFTGLSACTGRRRQEAGGRELPPGTAKLRPHWGPPRHAGCYSPKVAHVSRVSQCSQAECGPSAHSFRCLADVGIGLPWRQPGLSPLHRVVIDL